MTTNEKSVAKREEMQASILSEIKEMQKESRVYFPKKFSPENALKTAFIMLEDMTYKNQGRHLKPLETCEPTSIRRSITDMMIQGLSVAKTQGYFIVRNGKLCFDRSYFGTVAIVKRIPAVIDVFAQPVYKDDVFEFEIQQGRKIIKEHKQNLDSIEEGTIRACYSTIIYKDKEGNVKEYSEVMTFAQIQQSWEKSKNQSKTIHKEQPEEMSKRTVIARGCKMFINTTDDSNLDISDDVIGAFNRTGGREDIEPKDDANSGDVIDMTEEPEKTTEVVDEEGNIVKIGKAEEEIEEMSFPD